MTKIQLNPQKILDNICLVSKEGALAVRSNINYIESEMFSIEEGKTANLIIKISSFVRIEGYINLKIFYHIDKEDAFLIKDEILTHDNYPKYQGGTEDKDSKSHFYYVISWPVVVPFAKIRIESNYPEPIWVSAWSYLNK